MNSPVIETLRAELAQFNDRQLWAMLELVLQEMQKRDLFEESTEAPAAQLKQTATNLKLVEP